MQNIGEFLSEKYGADNVKFLGHGSDSAAYRVGDNVFRFTSKGCNLYEREAQICKFLAPYISCQIPDIKITSENGCFCAVHKMLQGCKWSWHKFQFNPRKQKNLARSSACFLGELHAVNTDDIRHSVPDIDAFGYIDFDLVRSFMSRYVPKFMLRFFERNYYRVIGDARTKSDLVVVHLGFKGANSVCNSDGTICGVYDFGNCGIYERSREFGPFLMGGNRALYRAMCREYKKQTGVSIDTRRVRDLAELEFMSEKRWIVNSDGAYMNDARFCQRRLASAILHFAHLPRFILRPMLLWYMKFYSSYHKI